MERQRLSRRSFVTLKKKRNNILYAGDIPTFKDMSQRYIWHLSRFLWGQSIPRQASKTRQINLSYTNLQAFTCVFAYTHVYTLLYNLQETFADIYQNNIASYIREERRCERKEVFESHYERNLLMARGGGGLPVSENKRWLVVPRKILLIFIVYLLCMWPITNILVPEKDDL